MAELAIIQCGCGEIGRRAGFRFLWETIWVRVPSSAPKKAISSGFLLETALFFALQAGLFMVYGEETGKESPRIQFFTFGKKVIVGQIGVGVADCA